MGPSCKKLITLGIYAYGSLLQEVKASDYSQGSVILWLDFHEIYFDICVWCECVKSMVLFASEFVWYVYEYT